MLRSILTVGDGNFSFSVALRTRLDSAEGVEGKVLAKACPATTPRILLTATSYDTRQDVVDKYPESMGLLRRLEVASDVCVLHGIDASDLGSANMAHSPFDLIIFNFPHTGVEDFRRHQALLAHFFDTAQGLLKSRGQVRM